jgi:hypothetical protein
MELDVYITGVEESFRAVVSKYKFINLIFFYTNTNYLILLKGIENAFLDDHPIEEGADGKGTSPLNLPKDR